MRLIDADELLKQLPTEEVNARITVVLMPTIEAEPLRRGRWAPSRDGYLTMFMCTSCYKIYGGSEKVYWHYCPNCGAKMENNDE